MMTKQEIIDHISAGANITKAQAGKALDAVLETIAEAMARGEEVRLWDFGTFSIAERAARQGRNPRTGEAIHIPASRQAKFRAAEALKRELNPQPESGGNGA